MNYFKDKQPNYSGKKHDLYILETCSKNMKKSGVVYRVLARSKKVCDTGNFGKEKEGYKYFEEINVGWLKWTNGTRVYYSKFEDEKIILLTVSGNKNTQEKDIEKAKELLDEITNQT